MAAPSYVAGIDFNAAVRQDAFDVMGRLVEHFRNKSTDQVPEQWREPVRNYRDEELFQREIEAVHRTAPLPLALSCELPDPGSHKAIDVAGTPVLITRDRQGEVHAMLNVCRHRGAEFVPEGTGKRTASPARTTRGATTWRDASPVSTARRRSATSTARSSAWWRCLRLSGPASSSSRSTPRPPSTSTPGSARS